MKNFQKIFLKITIISVLFLCLVVPVFAQVQDYTVLTPLPGTTKAGGDTTDLPTYLRGIFELSIAISAVLAFVMITWGGIKYATSDSISGTSTGRSNIENAIYGLILVIGAWVILNTINPNILKFQLDFPVASLATPPVTVTSTSVVGGTSINNTQPSMQKSYSALLVACPDCNIQITSTTGGTHNITSLHYKGLAIDVAPSTKLTEYLSGSIATPKECATFTKTLDGVSTTFLWEPKGAKCGGIVASTGDHWHVSVQ